MAKLSKSMSFRRAKIDLENMTLIEETKDNYEEFDLMEVLREWDGIDNLTIIIKKDDEIRSTITSEGNE